jgi:hypothetical protein
MWEEIVPTIDCKTCCPMRTDTQLTEDGYWSGLSLLDTIVAD